MFKLFRRHQHAFEYAGLITRDASSYQMPESKDFHIAKCTTCGKEVSFFDWDYTGCMAFVKSNGK